MFLSPGQRDRLWTCLTGAVRDREHRHAHLVQVSQRWQIVSLFHFRFHPLAAVQSTGTCKTCKHNAEDNKDV